MHSRGYRGSRESLHSGMTYSARRGSNASMYEGELIINFESDDKNNYTSFLFLFFFFQSQNSSPLCCYL